MQLPRSWKERFGVRAIAQAPRQYDSASAGMVEIAIRQIKDKARTIAARELRGVVMNPEHVALSWCVSFVAQIIVSDGEGQGWTHCIPTSVSTPVSFECHSCSVVRERSLHGRHHEERTAHRQIP